jgi:hypothetical protein
MPGVGRLVAKHRDQRLAGRVLRERKVAGGVRGVVRFTGLIRWCRVIGVARSACSLRGVAPEQANAPDAPEARLS